MAFISLLVALLIAIGGFFVYQSSSAPETNAPESAEQANTPSQIPALASVDRSGQNLTKMPSDILAMKNLQHLDLSNNKLTGALPAEIRHLQNLQVLDISNNQMTGLPAELGQLSKLRILGASNNQLTGIPHELGNLQNLEILDLSGNDISKEDLEIIRGQLSATTQIRL